MMPGHVATCRPEVLSPGQEMRFFMITRHHTGDGKYFEPIVTIMTERVPRLGYDQYWHNVTTDYTELCGQMQGNE